MPNIPATSIEGQYLISVGNGQNSSQWSNAQLSPPVVLAQHSVGMAVTSPFPINGPNDKRSFLATAPDWGGLTGPLVVSGSTVVAFLETPSWTNVDATVGRTVHLYFEVTDTPGSNGIRVEMSHGFTGGPGQSYTFTSSDYSGATVTTSGSDLTWGGTSGEILTASGTIAYTTFVIWQLT